ncbi:hypothetical protein ACLIA0_07760 [Bacillaceae bacterium W0354]
MKKRLRLIILIIIVLLINLSLVYYQNYSLSSVLSQTGFDKGDIIDIDILSEHSLQSHNVILVANKKKMGFIEAKRNKYGLWSPGSAGISQLERETYITMPKTLVDEKQNKHIYLVVFADEEKYKEIESINPELFRLVTKRLEINGKQVLHIHAIAEKEKDNLSSSEVVDFLKLK